MLVLMTKLNIETDFPTLEIDLQKTKKNFAVTMKYEHNFIDNRELCCIGRGKKSM